MNVDERRQVLRSFTEGERVRINVKRDVEHRQINPEQIYIFIGQNHDFDAIVIAEGQKDTLDNRQKVLPSSLVKLKQRKVVDCNE